MKFLSLDSGTIQEVDLSGATGPTNIAIGNNAGVSQGLQSIAIGSQAGQSLQGPNCIAIGQWAGTTLQGVESIAIGMYAGMTWQANQAVAIGAGAGSYAQEQFATATGYMAGYGSQSSSTYVSHTGTTLVVDSTALLLIGSIIEGTGYTSLQTIVSITNGTTLVTSAPPDSTPSGQIYFYKGQGQFATAVGYRAGQTNQGANAVAIGLYAGQTNQPANTIILNATDIPLDGVSAQTDSFYVNPIRNAAGTSILYYDATTKEITYGGGGGTFSEVSNTAITPILPLSQYSLTALSSAVGINAPIGTALDGQKFTYRILDNGTPQGITLGGGFSNTSVVPTTTTASKFLYIGAIYNSATTLWDIVAISEEV